MAETLFWGILTMSATASLVIVAVMLMRLGLRRAPKVFSYALWGVVLFRLLCPVSFSSGLSLMGFVEKGISGEAFSGKTFPERLFNAVSQEEEAASTGGGMAEGMFSQGNGIGDAALLEKNGQLNQSGNLKEKMELEEEADIKENAEPAAWLQGKFFENYGSFVWLAGLVILAAYSIWSALRMHRMLKDAVWEHDNVYRCNLPTPFVYGVFRPRIYLPVEMEDWEREYVLLHERIHIRRGDHIIRMLSFLALCLHWFNPLVWAAFFLSGKDMEMSCDEAVLGVIGKERKKVFRIFALSFAIGKHIVGGMPVAFGEGDTKSRIKNVLRYKKPAVWLAGIAAAACVVAGIMLLANPKDGKPGENGGIGENTENGEASEILQAQNESAAGADETGTEADGRQDSEREQDNEKRDASGAIVTKCSADVMNETTGKPALIIGEKLRKFTPELLAATKPEGEIFKEEELAGRVYRVYKNGIFVAEDETERCVYPQFAGIEPYMSVFDGRLYFTSYSYYIENPENTLDWIDDTICWVDLATLESGTFQIGDWVEITFFRVWDAGISLVNGVEITEQSAYLVLPEPEKKRYLAMDGTAFMTKQPVTGKSTEMEKEAFGLAFSEQIRKDSVKLWDVSDRETMQTLAWLDLDDDGDVEEISFAPNESAEEEYEYPWDAHYLKVEDSMLVNHMVCQSNGIYAFCPDGKEIILALYSDGPSGDLETHFYAYRENELQSLGDIWADIRKAEFHEDGTFTETLRNDTIQTDWIRTSWGLDEKGEIVQIPQETYEYVAKNAVKLLTEVEVQTELDGGKIFTVQPQTILFTAVNRDFTWVEIELEDGSRAWLNLAKLVRTYPEEYVMREEVFEDLQFMD